jgi:putative CocE/NonD family hydrolase
MPTPRALALALAALVAAAPAAAQVATDPSLVYDRIQAMVPTRDGVRLETEVYVPKGAREKLPILFMRTPYGFDPDEKGFSRWLARPWLSDLLRDGYVLALQSVRGRSGSEGAFALERAPRDRRDPRSVDEGTDAFDTVEWLVIDVPSSGRVGLIGASNPARLVAYAMREHHPAVKAYSPQAVPADNFVGDDYFHQGAFRLAPIMPFMHAMERSRAFARFEFDQLDLYAWFLALGSLAHVDERFFHGRVPSWTELVAHPAYDALWRARALPALVEGVPAPTLHVGGAYDQEDRRGPVALYRAMERHDARGENFLVVGPWAHRTWRLHDGERLGPIDFGSPTARFFREEVQAPFFACHLKGRCGAKPPEALVFQTGSNVWQRLDAWPPRGAKERTLWLREGGALAFEPPARDGPEEADAYRSDPAAPVPYQARPIAAPNLDHEAAERDWPVWQVADQRFADGRPDVLDWRSAPLAEDVVVAGQITAHLLVSTTGTDADFAVKLVDVWPEAGVTPPSMGGYELMVAGEIARGRFRRSLERPEPFTPGRVEAVDVDLLTRSHVFKKGHRILVQVQSTWFPLYDRNPQTFVENVFLARDSDFRAQTHRVHRSRAWPSRVTFQSP